MKHNDGMEVDPSQYFGGNGKTCGLWQEPWADDGDPAEVFGVRVVEPSRAVVVRAPDPSRAVVVMPTRQVEPVSERSA